MKPQNLPETVVWYYIISGYLLFFLGAQPVFAPLVALFLAAYLLIQWWNQAQNPTSTYKINISLSSWIWIIAMLVIALAVIVGGIDFRYGISSIIKSVLSQGWLRTWGLIGLFILAGNLNIRPQLISRAVCIFCLQSLIVVPIIYLMINFTGVPDHLYVSPLQIFKGSVDTYSVRLSYGEDGFFPGFERLSIIAPWPTPFGLFANIYFFIVQLENNKKLRFFSMIAPVMMIIFSGSRLALLCMLSILALVWFLTNFTRPWIYFLIGLVAYIVGLLPNLLIDSMGNFKAQFDQLRSGAEDSSNARGIMVRVGIERWKNEAPIWGHTPIAQDNIPKPLVVTPIGSHHTWVGLLFDHGLVGCIAFAIAMGWSFIDLLIKAQTSKNAKVGLGVLLIITIFSFAEPIPTYAYLLWPGFLLIGTVLKETNVVKPQWKQSLN